MRDPWSKPVFTSGDVARICCISINAVNRWVDSGRLIGYRIPGSRHRRIPAKELRRFMDEHGIPTDLGEQAG